jgi:predicted ribosomally synthesized peptide with nif11-like leader
MLSDVIAAFIETVKNNDALKAQLMAPDADVMAIAKAAGHDLDAAAVAALRAELSDAELDAISGGYSSWRCLT